MIFHDCRVIGARVIEPEPRHDERGRFMRAWCSREFASYGIEFTPLQSNMAYSRHKGTVRGLHFQAAPALEAKLVRCTRGEIFDVVVDLRPDSRSYRQWFGVRLSAENGWMLFIPEGCAHGCQTLEDHSELTYMTSAIYSPQDSRGARYDDPAFGIEWPLPLSSISEQDRNWPRIDPGSS